MFEDKNFLVAMLLCIAILFGWQVLVIDPEADKQRVVQEAEAQAAKIAAEREAASLPSSDLPTPDLSALGGDTSPQVEGAFPNAAPTVPGQIMGREQALAQSPRVMIDSPRLRGSIALRGARIDDLQLKDYHETIDKSSAEITLLSPKGTTQAYFAEYGWSSVGNSVIVPNSTTEWVKDSTGSLTPGNPLRLSWDNKVGQKFFREIALDDDYMFRVTQSVENYARKAVTLYPYGLAKRYGTPEIEGFFILHEGLLGVFDGTLMEVDYDEIQEEKKIKAQSTGGWFGFTDKYWMVTLVPDQDQKFTGKFSDHLIGDTNVYQADFIQDGITIPTAGRGETSSHLFAGAKKVSILEHYQEQLGIERFDLAIDWGWLFFLTKPFFVALDWVGKVVGNFGVAILIITVLIKAAFFPLANKSYVATTKMKKLQPEMTKLRERFSDDKVRQQQEIMELYKREKVNPMAGCLPMIVQIPVFFALYKVLFVTIEMRHAPFFGWIQDLSAPDPTSLFNLFGLIPWSLPSWAMIGIWPLIMGVTMLLQTKMNPPPADPVQEKVFLLMPIFFTFFLAGFPAGLVIYWAWNNFLSIVQQYTIMRRMGVKVDLIERLAIPGLTSRAPDSDQAAPDKKDES